MRPQIQPTPEQVVLINHLCAVESSRTQVVAKSGVPRERLTRWAEEGLISPLPVSKRHDPKPSVPTPEQKSRAERLLSRGDSIERAARQMHIDKARLAYWIKSGVVSREKPKVEREADSPVQSDKVIYSYQSPWWSAVWNGKRVSIHNLPM